MTYKVLVVDNQPLMLEFMKALLEKEGHQVKCAGDGLEAIETAKEFHPDIFFIDMIMPHIDGARLCAVLRKYKEFKKSLLVIISGIAAEGGHSYIGAEADACIAKGPFDKTAVHVLKILEIFTSGNIRQFKNKILGIDEIYRREVTKELLFTHKHLEVLLSSMTFAVLEFLEDFRIVYANPSAEEIFRMKEFELLSQDIRNFIPEDFHKQIEEFIKDKTSRKLELGDEKLLQINERFIHVVFLPVEEGANKSIMGIFRDVSKYKIAQDELNESLKLKDTLLKEIHHRIKNNLSLITSLLDIQKCKVNDSLYNNYIDEIRGRIQSIELIHEKLCDSDDFKTVNLAGYLHDLSVMIVNSITANEFGVSVSAEGSDLKVSTRKAVPLGLITAEIITNAVKYGFGNPADNPDLKGKVPGIILKLQHDRKIRIIIENNGTPFPEDINVYKSESLGMILIHDLADQLDAEYKIKAGKNGGTIFSISFEAD